MKSLSLPHVRLPPLSWPLVVMLFGFAVVTAALGHWLKPTQHAVTTPVDLTESLPVQIGVWHYAPSNFVQMSLTPTDDRGAAVAATYDESLMRTYVDGQGHQIMVALAYGANQRQEGKIHRPELCYAAQGFKVRHAGEALVPISRPSRPARQAKVNRLVTQSGDRLELVSYWIRIGHEFPQNAVESRLYLIAQGLANVIPDGILFRVSQLVDKTSTPDQIAVVFARQERFMQEAAVSGTETGTRLLTGSMQ
jgi:EpsI family protein